MLLGSLMSNLHGVAPEQCPVHPVKRKPSLGIEVKLTDSPFEKSKEHVSLQVSLLSCEETDPPSLTSIAKVTFGVGDFSNTDLIVFALSITNLHVLVPEQSPAQPIKLFPSFVVAIISMEELAEISVTQEVVQFILLGCMLIVPKSFFIGAKSIDNLYKLGEVAV
jgi:hypothetical protein